MNIWLTQKHSRHTLVFNDIHACLKNLPSVIGAVACVIHRLNEDILLEMVMERAWKNTTKLFQLETTLSIAIKYIISWLLNWDLLRVRLRTVGSGIRANRLPTHQPIESSWYFSAVRTLNWSWGLQSPEQMWDGVMIDEREKRCKSYSKKDVVLEERDWLDNVWKGKPNMGMYCVV